MNAAASTILIIDDEVQIRRLLRAALEGAGFKVQEADCGQLGVSEIALCRPDAVVLDLGLPDLSGLEVLRRVREWSRLPVLILSVREGPEDKISALDAGADDYVTKPFDTRELLARLRAILRRTDLNEDQPEFHCSALHVDFVARKVTVKGKEIHLTPTEYTLLRVLARHAGKVVTHRQLLREGWGPGGEEHGEYLRVHLTHLRKKIEKDGNRLIQTEPGVGYRMCDSDGFSDEA